jgi:hypothetical protein
MSAVSSVVSALEPRFVGEEMIAMIRIPRVCLILVVTALLVLMVAPIAGARTVSSPSAHPSESGWIGAALHWVEGLVGIHHPAASGHRGTKPVTTKAEEDAIIGTCIDPMGRPKPCY